ncbi:MAG: hypothetical protein CMD12_00655 [Flavobacteriales bacterium]|nr:hypothetical protein [Flavobacteriales bacterium]|tara:strand:- start:2786 stop:3682 length:897 start_codon:yes stop_codon:yes gene_type:complete
MKLELKNLYKEFKVRNFFQIEKKSVLEDINLTLDDGDILGLLGRNGAGKTTLLKIILGLIHPSQGSVVFTDKKDPQFGFTSANPRSFYWRISCRENLTFFGKMLGLTNKEIDESINQLSDILGISDILDKSFMLLSSGQMQCINIARSLLKKPDLLLLDEPTTSLDFESSKKIINTTREYLMENKIPAIWCSHDYLELNRVSNKFGLLKDKKFIFNDSEIFKFHQKAINYEFEILNTDLEKIKFKLDVVITKSYNSNYFFTVSDKDLDLDEILKLLTKNDIKIVSLEKNFNHFEDFIL